MKDFRTFGVSEKIENLEKIGRTAVRGHRPRPLDDGSSSKNPSPPFVPVLGGDGSSGKLIIKASAEPQLVFRGSRDA